MTLREFLTATSDVPQPLLREAMTAALLVEPARNPNAYRRFYGLVMDELSRRGAVTRRLTPSSLPPPPATPECPECPDDWDSLSHVA